MVPLLAKTTNLRLATFKTPLPLNDVRDSQPRTGAERVTIHERELPVLRFSIARQHNGGLQLRRAISIQAEGKELLEKHAIAPSAARLC